MGLTICLEDEDGNLIEKIKDDFELYPLNINDNEFKLIGGIDLYGDTVFNRIQVPALLEDFEKLKNKITDLKTIEKINEIIELGNKCENEIHTYLKFYGD